MQILNAQSCLDVPVVHGEFEYRTWYPTRGIVTEVNNRHKTYARLSLRLYVRHNDIRNKLSGQSACPI